MYSEGSHKMVLIQAYHITADHDLTLQLSGSWVLHSTDHNHLVNEKDESPTILLSDSDSDLFKTNRLRAGEGILNLPNIDWEAFKKELKPVESVLSKNVKFGSLEELRGDPLLRRVDLTGVHLRCTTIQVSQSF